MCTLFKRRKGDASSLHFDISTASPNGDNKRRLAAAGSFQFSPLCSPLSLASTWYFPTAIPVCPTTNYNYQQQQPSYASMAEDELLITSLVPSKVILAGEHSVVYGETAIVAALNHPRLELRLDTSRQDLDQLTYESRQVVDYVRRRLRCRHPFSIDVKSSIPIGSGLGSSAAFCVGVVSAVNELLHRTDKRKLMNREDVWRIAREAEQILHGGKSSGVDIAACSFGGLCKYHKDKGIMSKLKAEDFDFDIVLVDTGVKRSTAVQNYIVSQKREEECGEFHDIMSGLGRVTTKLWTNVAGHNFCYQRLYEQISECHELLDKLGLSHNSIKNVVDIAQQYGVAAKLTGAGGGGCVLLVLPKHFSRKRELCDKLSEVAADVFQAGISTDGYRVQTEILDCSSDSGLESM